MKRTLLALVVALAVLAPAPAQAAERSGGHHDELTFITAGDSIVAGAGSAGRKWGWPGRLHRTNRDATHLMRNAGHSASCLVFEGCGHGETLLSTFGDEVLSLRPDVAIVAIGRNDLCHVTTAEFIAALRSLRADGATAGVRVVFGTITPPNERWQWPCEEQAEEINSWIRAQDGSIDFAAAVANRDGELQKRYDHGDGLHPSGRGYEAMARAAEAVLLG